MHEAIDVATVNVSIYSMIGERVLQTELAGYQQYLFDISAMARGVYLVKVMHGDDIWIEKVVKQ